MQFHYTMTQISFNDKILFRSGKQNQHYKSKSCFIFSSSCVRNFLERSELSFNFQVAMSKLLDFSLSLSD